jgi:hypothetical protein
MQVTEKLDWKGLILNTHREWKGTENVQDEASKEFLRYAVTGLLIRLPNSL